jgi:hypothetical protein
MSHLLSGFSGIAIACLIPAAGLSQVVLEGGGVTLRAPASLDCAALPVIAVEGAIAEALAGDRAAIGDAVLRMSQGIASACPAAEALEFQGSDREVTIAFRTAKAQGWRMAGTAAAPAAPAAPGTAAEASAKTTPAAGAAATPAPVSTAPQTAAAEPPPEDTPPPIAPGIAFNDLTQFYGGVPTVRGHAALDRSEPWSRVLAARAYAERPDLLNDDLVALEIAQQMLNPAEFQQFVGALGPQVQRGFQNLSVFDRRDLAERVRNQLAPYLDQRRQTGPIDVYHTIPLRLADYSFDRGAFPFQGNPGRNHPEPAWRGYGLHRLLDGVALPTELRTTSDEARQIDEYLRARRDPTVHLAVFLTVDPRAPDNVAQANQRGERRPVAVKQVALYADRDLTQLLFDYTPVLAEQQTAIAAVQAELARPVLTGEALVKSVAALSGGATRVDETIAAMARQAAQNGGVDVAAAERTVRGAFDRAPAQERVRLAGSFNIRDVYDSRVGGLPVQYFSLQAPRFTSEQMSLRLDLTTFPDLSVLPVSQEAAQAIVAAMRSRGVEIFVEGNLVQGVQQAVTGNQVQISATLTPRRVLVFSGSQGNPVAERALLADVTLAEGPSLPVAAFPTFGAPVPESK